MVRSRIKETVTLSDETMAPKEFSQKKNISKMKESQQETRDPIKRPTRYDKLSPLQKNFYYHLWKLNAKVRKRNSVLTSSDFDDQAPRSWLTGSESSQKLARQWQAELRRNDKTTDGVKQEEPHTSTKIKGPSLKRAIWRTYGAAYLLILLCVFLTDLVLEPAYFYLAIRLIEIIGEFVPSHKHVFQVDHNINHNSSSTGILTNFTKSFQDHDTKQLYSHALIFLVTIVTYQLLTHPYAWLNLKMGLRLRVALSEMIYKKSLRIDSFSATKQQISQEQASNLISRDLETLEARFGELGLVFAGPLQCLVFTLIISQQLDVWTALMACILNASACVQRSYTNFRLRKCSRLASGVADKRMDLVSETIEAIRLVRMYAWTRPLEAKIELNRNEEITHRERQLATRAVDVALFFIITSASALIALMFAYYVRGLPFTRSMVSQLFLVTATYRRALSGNLAKGMQAWTQVLVVIERCQKYLMVANMPDSSEELNERTKWIHDSSKGVADGAGAGFGQLYEMVSVMVEKPPIREDKLDKLTSSVCQLKNVSLAWPQARQATTTTKCDCQKSEAGLDRFGGQKFCLRQVDLSAQEGELVLVAGQVGSGKSTLLQILLGEMAPTTGLVHRRPGIKVAYVSQKAWIFSGSVRENILMGQTFNLERYYEVIRVSALIPDLSAFPDFDRTRIGERGVTLSGGQKARVNLARALYQRADLYLLDDPLSAVDGRVSSYIFREALRGHLRGKTIILVTHQTQYLNQVDKILYLGSRHDDSQRQATHNNFFGTFEQLERSNLLGELLACSQEHSNTDKKVGRDPNHLDNYEENNTTQLMNRNSVTSRIMSNETIDKSTDATADATMVSTQNIAHSDTSCFYQDEMYEISESRRKKLGRVRTSKMGRAMLFYMHNAGGLVATLLFALVNILSRVLYLNINIFLNFWAGYQIWSQPDDGSRPILLGNRLTVSTSEPPSPILEDDQRPNWFASWLIQLSLEGALGVAGLIWLGIIGISSIRTVQFYRMGSRAGRLIHARLIHSLLWTKLTFFDRTPQGHLINRLAADISYLDSVLIYQLDQLSVTGLSMTFVFVGIVMSSPKLMPVVCLLSVVFYLLLRHMTDLMELIKYLDGFRRSSLYSHVGTTIDGLPTIRSAKQAPTFTRKFNRLLDQHSSVRFLMASVRRLIIGSFDFILVAFYIFLVVFMLYDTLNGDGTYAFISLNLVVQLTRIAQNTMVVVVDFFLTIHSMDRIREYATELEHEKLQLHGPYIDSHRDLVELTRTRIASERQNDNRTRAATAQACSSMCDDRSVGLGEARFTEGAIRFSGVSLKFLLANKLVLDNVSFYIEPGLKVGIIGRTGAGKSSLITVLFHLYHFEGFVQVDGQDTKLLQLESLRKSISIIPQDPCLFTGSIRHNLDPFNEHSDEKLWRSLEVVQLKQLVQSSELGLEMPVTKSGGNFSIGQRQLICLARAILKENKILVMDEATSNIDQETDSLIQLAIKNEFKHCTVLTIAHRLSTVIELDRLMIMQDGRVAEFGTPVELLERGSNGLLCGMIESLGEQQATLLRNKITSNT